VFAFNGDEGLAYKYESQGMGECGGCNFSWYTLSSFEVVVFSMIQCSIWGMLLLLFIRCLACV
jgi:hypothetical protein